MNSCENCRNTNNSPLSTDLTNHEFDLDLYHTLLISSYDTLINKVELDGALHKLSSSVIMNFMFSNSIGNSAANDKE